MTTPRLELLRDYFDAVGAGDVDRLATFWADDMVFEAPFSYTGGLSRTVGKQAVYDRLNASYGRVSFAFTITEVYELADPDALIVEYQSDGHMLETGERYTNCYITLVRWRGDEMTLFREFYDSQLTKAAFG